MTLAAFLLLALKASVVAMIVAIGMGSRPSALAYLWRRPALLVRSLAAMYLLVPLAALAIVKLLPLAPATKAALLVLAVSAGAPLIPKKLVFLEREDYVFGLAVTSSLLAIVVAPAWVAVLARHFGADAELSALTVAAIVAKGFLLPLAAGMAAHALWPAASERLAQRALAALGLAMAICGLILVALHFELLREVSVGGALALAALLAVALAIGHAMGGPERDDRTALAVACATRHLGIAVLVGSSFPGPRTVVLVVAYVLIALLVTMPYVRRRRRSALHAAIAGPIA